MAKYEPPPIDPDSWAYQYSGFRNDEQRDYIRDQWLEHGNARPLRDYIDYLRYEEMNPNDMDRVFRDLWDAMEDYPPEERDELLHSIFSP